MEEKKVQEKGSRVEAARQTKGLWSYLEEIKGEFRKITWTSRDELVAYTKIVVGATLVFGMAIYGVDIAIQLILAGLDALILKVAG
jgi:preprotein translocase subunit SecE